MPHAHNWRSGARGTVAKPATCRHISLAGPENQLTHCQQAAIPRSFRQIASTPQDFSLPGEYAVMVRSALISLAWLRRLRSLRIPVVTPMAHPRSNLPDDRAASSLRGLTNWIPGLGEYARGEDHHQRDLADRAWIADQLSQGKQGLERYARLLVEAGQHDLLISVDRIRHETDRLAALIRGTPIGRNHVNVSENEALLSQFAGYTAELIQQAAEIADAMEDLAAAPTTKPARNKVEPLTEIATRLATFTTIWEARVELVQEA